MKKLFLIVFLNLIFTYLANDLKNLKSHDLTKEILKTDINLNIKCFLYNDLKVYDLKGLSRDFKNNTDFTINLTNWRIYYNFCENTLQKCNGSSSQMIAENITSNECRQLAGNANNPNTWKIINGSDSNSSVISITLNSGGQCINNKLMNYSVKINLACDKNGTKKKINWDENNLQKFNPNECTNELQAKSFEACAQVDFYILVDFLNQYFWLFGAAMILIGLFQLFFGIKLVAFTTFLISSIIVISIVTLLFTQYIIPAGTNPNYIWVIFGISGVIGLICGYFLSKAFKLFVALFGGYIGYLLGNILYTIGTSHIKGNQELVWWLTVISVILLSLVLSYFFADYILITGTSFFGGYMIVRGISLYAGGFPNEQLLKNLMQNEEYDEIAKVLNWKAYLYFGLWFLIFVIGWIVQFKIKREQDDEKKADDKKIDNSQFYFKMDK